jgi:hypothetical protein
MVEREATVTQPNQSQPEHVAPRKSRLRLQFGLATLFLAVTAIAIGLSWFTRADRFYDSPQVYGFELVEDGQPTRGGVAFVLQHRFFPQHRRLQWVIFIDLRPNQFNPDASADMAIKHVGRYQIVRHESCEMLSIPDIQTKHGWGLCVEDFDFGSGAVFDMLDLRYQGPDGMQTILNGAFALKSRHAWPTLTWDELLEFISDQSVEEWNVEVVQKWKAS